MVEVVPQDERLLAADDPGRLERGGDVTRGISRPQHNKSLRHRFNRNERRPGEPASDRENYDQNETEKFSHDGSSVDESERRG